MEKIINENSLIDMLIFPEGSLSGYITEGHLLSKLDNNKIDKYIEKLQILAIQYKISIWFGTIIYENGNYYNSAIGISSDGLNRYDKINLATNEREHFSSGNTLPLFIQRINGYEFKFAVQLCRELKFPEQWKYLSLSGANVIFHMNNAIGDDNEYNTWKSQLIARASENQRFVISVNNAGIDQKCPTIAIQPDGKIISEIKSSKMMQDIIDTIEKSISKGLTGTDYEDRILHQQSHLIEEAARSGKILRNSLVADIVTNVGGNNWTSTRTMQVGDTEGAVGFTIDGFRWIDSLHKIFQTFSRINVKK